MPFTTPRYAIDISTLDAFLLAYGCLLSTLYFHLLCRLMHAADTPRHADFTLRLFRLPLLFAAGLRHITHFVAYFDFTPFSADTP